MDKNFIVSENIGLTKTKMFINKLRLAVKVFKSQKTMIFFIVDKEFHVEKVNVSSQETISLCDTLTINEYQNLILENKVKQLVENA